MRSKAATLLLLLLIAASAIASGWRVAQVRKAAVARKLTEWIVTPLVAMHPDASAHPDACGVQRVTPCNAKSATTELQRPRKQNATVLIRVALPKVPAGCQRDTLRGS